ncbi:TlpA family protein disulfide reductase [Lawsonia intracellularis]|uniref:Thiol-disulfide isomerase and thioredoxins n=1 Tax=Lawsonia intracellularis (strain PHE/MN1-00) TaxID=363253 RepID=Q1MQQ9_LAWIP|nr:TlpA disulfide reductase family protein [Lawsonia intracellularis]AGC50031.1 thioredoxin family protein [Lawsonia intracellularis N343]KAA0204728.1 TlpA family protein disulfide reductase [Lawsonia intracellularis]MBZ3893095.1 TlpA family protein disulfide reductase [Lawsonia intracellularis]OMQ04308.1 thiol-disulfide isomerase [Lawsonia intracellularis]RBN33359.1 TlpA family protein disulfide reductase [Lawsonia intracellularis]
MYTIRTIFLYTLFIALTHISLAHAEEIKTIQGKELAYFISQNKGKPIFITVFATWCPACRQEMPGIIATQQKYSKEQVTFIGISLDDNVENLQNYIKQSKITFPVYIAGSTIPSMFSITAIPHNIIYDKKGTLVMNKAGALSANELNTMLNKYIK